jgi:hypothetical protein
MDGSRYNELNGIAINIPTVLDGLSSIILAPTPESSEPLSEFFSPTSGDLESR